MKFELEQHEETKPEHRKPAPGRPGDKPLWETGAKTAVGTSVTAQSRIWFTIGRGYLNEIYFPDVDRANTRFVRFLVTSDDKFISDEAGDTEYLLEATGAGIPAYRVLSQCKQGRYSLEKEIITDPDRDTLLMRVVFKPAREEHRKLRLYVFSNPHVGDLGAGNNGWVGQYKGIRMLFAQRDGLSCAMACSAGFKAMSCGFIGVSDGLTDLRQGYVLTNLYTSAERGNVGLTGEIDWTARDGNFTLALSFGGTPGEAGQQARAGLLLDFDEVRKQYIAGWQEFQPSIHDLSRNEANDLYRVSAAALRIHESKRFRGAFVASLSIPWGFDRSDKDVGGYHVTWPRDMSATAHALLAAGDADSARRALFYLECTQDADGHWPQNMWLDGSQHWTSRQMDETAFPILLADALRRNGELRTHNVWPLVKKAAGYLVRHGPLAQEDRWEQLAGYSTFTMAVEIAALLAAADFAEAHGEHHASDFLRETADAWNEAVDELTYASGTDLARRCGVEGYYVRLTPPEAIRAESLDVLTIELRNHPKRKQTQRAVDIVSPDALALVRYGLRAPDDPRISNTIKVIDETLLTVTSTGPVWHRYTDDGYGERSDGRPFHKTGIGRGWPLLAGERAHYELAKDDVSAAEALRATIARQTSECGLMPEQVWDAPDIPEHGLFNGQATGSGRPLVWAHAEYIQLLRSLRDGKVWSTPPQTVERYLRARRACSFQIWTLEQPRARVASGKNLRLDLPFEAGIAWSTDGWRTSQQTHTQDSALCVQWTMLPVAQIAPGTLIQFRLPDGKEHEIQVRANSR